MAAWKLAVMYAPDLVGFALPPVVEFLGRDVKRENEKFWLTMMVCLLAGVLLKWNQLVAGDPEQVIIWGAIVFAQSQIVFKTYFKDSRLRQEIQHFKLFTVKADATPAESAQALSDSMPR